MVSDADGSKRAGKVRPRYVLWAAGAAVASTYLAAMTPETRAVHLSALAIGVGLALFAGLSLIWKMNHVSAKATLTVMGVLGAMASISALGVGSMVAAEGPRRRQIDALVTELETKDFYRYASPGATDRAKRLRTAEEVLFDESTGRVFPFDPAELAQGGATRFVVRVSGFLEKEGVKLHTLNNNFEIGGAYVLQIDGLEHELYSRDEATSPRVGDLCVERLSLIVNDLLREAHSGDSLRIFQQGNVSRAVFLSNGQFRVLAAASLRLEAMK